ncbi:MAG: protoporphyrinogen oxidase, partial [Sinomicrobium sp.]|nr:protoporphyrinogen oxidase [Sinomicrobium sp.]
IKELSLENALIEADQQAKIRYILKHNRLQPIPTKPQEFFRSSILNPIQKLRLLTEVIQPKKELRRENVYEFAQRRLGKGAADWLIDPMVSGIYGGDAHKIGLSAAFPRMAELEQKYGSLFKAMHALKKTNGRAGPMPNGTLMSFQSGMKQLIDALGQKYKTNITMSSRIKTLAHNGKKYQIYTDVKAYEADEVYCCAPAYATARLFRSLDHVLADDLDSIEYAPIAVVSLVYKRSAFADTPKGFGFLVPSLEKKKLLGVLFDSNIFPNRSAGDQFICRAMVGGIRHPDIRSEKTESLLNYTVSELKTILNIQQEPVASKIILWTEAIPQYTTEYIDLQKRIESRL